MRQILITSAAAIAILGAGERPAAASGFQVAPTRVVLDEESPGAALHVVNQRPEAARFRVSVHAWSQREDGEMVLAETRDVRIYPRHLEVPGQGRAVIRVLASPRFGALERPYRIVVEELPRERLAAAEGTDVRMRIAIPVFLASHSPRRDTRVADLHVRADGAVRFALKNAGTVHERPRAVEVVGYDGAGREVARARQRGWYVLPGGRLRHELSLGGSACELARVEIRVQAEDGAWELTQPATPPRCPDA